MPWLRLSCPEPAVECVGWFAVVDRLKVKKTIALNRHRRQLESFAVQCEHFHVLSEDSRIQLLYLTRPTGLGAVRQRLAQPRADPTGASIVFISPPSEKRRKAQENRDVFKHQVKPAIDPENYKPPTVGAVLGKGEAPPEEAARP